MNQKLEQYLITGALLACAASFATLLTFALQAEPSLQRISISLGLSAIEAESQSREQSTSLELVSFPSNFLGLSEFAPVASSELIDLRVGITSSHLTFFTELASQDDCAQTYQMLSEQPQPSYCKLGLPAESLTLTSLEIPPLLATLDLATPRLNQSTTNPDYQ